MAMPNPADTLKEVSKELKEKFDEAGMGSVETFMDTIDDIKDKAAAGPGAALDAVQAKFDEFKGKIGEAIEKPSSLAPANMALIAEWYGSAVAAKLAEFKATVEEMINSLVALAKEITSPMKTLGETLANAMAALEKTLKKLAKLPAEVGKMAAEIDSPDDIAKIDVDSMKACLDVSGIDAPLKSMGDVGGTLGSAIDKVKEGLKAIEDFISNAGDQIKACFQVPPPLCFATSCAMQAAPQPLKDMLDMVDNLKKVDLSSLVNMLTKTMETLSTLDIAMVKTPVDAFSKSAGSPIDKLDKAVTAAKLSSDPAGAIGGMVPKGMGGMF
eukprot:TRINITY_DN1386_c0_g1_i1.p1 TRINITY_DN1386_c0_g1~~TRINITY_DN1386_c0_g1_i1.p1  ORF type:complete len:327 (-),score=141.32 TRINITY_DN1386_c0_g1_i1:144-1124(-)